MPVGPEASRATLNFANDGYHDDLAYEIESNFRLADNSAETIVSRHNMVMPLPSGPPVSLAFAESRDVLLYRSE